MYRSLSLMIPQKPWLGWSYEEYEIEQARQVESGEVSDVILKMANTHNTYLEVWVFHGAIGLLSLMTVLLVAFAAFCRRMRSPDPMVQTAAICGASLVVGYGISSLTQVMLA